MFTERVPFQEVIEDKYLLKPVWDKLSVKQQVFLKSIYGLPLNTAKEHEAWSILQGRCLYDELGYPTTVYDWPYTPKEYNEVWAIIGRRSGKSFLASFITVYEAIFGGHLAHVTPGQETVIYYVAQKLNVAEAQLKTIISFLRQSEVMKEFIPAKYSTDRVELTNGMTIVASPPSLRGQRGFAVPVAICDEVGFWRSEEESANPDIEVEKAIKYAQAQFPNYKYIGISTPWTKQGLLWKYYNAGTEGEKLIEKKAYEGVLVHYAPTAAMDNPKLTKTALRRLAASDPDTYERESLAHFIDSVSGFLPEVLIRECINKGKKLQKPDISKYTYVAAIDPAFRHDAFALSICHRNELGHIELDVILSWKPTKQEKLNPLTILDEMIPWLRSYNIQTVFSDQYHFDSFQQLAQQKGISVSEVTFSSKSKAKIYGDLETLFKSKRISILDPEQSNAAKDLVQELIRMEKKSLSSGNVQISAPPGQHDDLATALAISVHMALQFAPLPKVVNEKQETLLSRYLDKLEDQKRLINAMDD